MDQVQQMALSDPEPALRLQALEVIGKQNNERAKEALTQIAQGGDEVTSGRAGELLEKLNQTQ
jgi:HEAT repeat protein